MLCIVSPTTDPFFNLAAEEYLFKNFGEDIFFLYINSPSVVVGKHQNAMAEINPIFVFENDIKVIRRMSGGGAVYHDPGNLNFSFHKTVNDTSKVVYSDFNVPVVELLNQLKIPAEISRRNDILVNGFKVSGHAQHVFRNKLLSHGTLLINSDLGKLSESLRKGSGDYESKAIKSIRSSVANVSGFFLKTFTAEEFRNLLFQHILKTVSSAIEYHLNNSDLDRISELAKQKYSTREWNFGYSPSYRFSKEMIFSSKKKMTCELTVEKGIISDAKIEGNVLTETEMVKIIKGLIKKPHHPKFLMTFFEEQIHSLIPSTRFIELFF